MSEWIERTPNELTVDAVGLWQIIPVGRDSFSLDGNELEDFARRSIGALIDRGAVPVRASDDAQIFWVKQEQYGVTSTEIAESILSEWKRSGVDPDVDGIWFALI